MATSRTRQHAQRIGIPLVLLVSLVTSSNKGSRLVMLEQRSGGRQRDLSMGTMVLGGSSGQ